MKFRTPAMIAAIAALGIGGALTWSHYRAPAPQGAAAASKPDAPAPKSGEKGDAAKKGGPRRDTAPIRVSGFVAKAAPFSDTITASGSLRADESVEVQSELTGKIVALNFSEGTAVHAGDVLLKIDDTTLQASLRRAEARRELARVREQRLLQLVKGGGTSQQDYDEALSALAVQDAEVDLIRAELAKTEIRAPFDGIAGLRFVSLGAYVTPTTRIATLQRVSELKVDFSVPERYSSAIRAGAPISFSVAGHDEKFTGSVYAVEPRIDVSTRTVLLRARCANPGLTLLPGLFARIELTVTTQNDAILIPAQALISGLEERYVFLAKNGRAERTLVRTGARTATHVQVTGGITPGSVVLTSGIQQLRGGLAVEVDLVP